MAFDKLICKCVSDEFVECPRTVPPNARNKQGKRWFLGYVKTIILKIDFY